MVLALPLLAQSVAAAQTASTAPVKVAVKCGGGPIQKWRHIQPTPALDKCLGERGALVGETRVDDRSATNPNPSPDRAAAGEARRPAEQ